MEPKHDTTSADFVSQWGLRFDPFAPEAEVPFFPGTGFGAALAQLEHYCRYGNLLLVVTGPGGAGKTMLRKEFVRRHAEEAEVCALLAHPLHTTAQVLHQVAQAFGLGDDLLASPDDEVEAFLRRLAGLGGPARVLVVDDADALDASVVAALVFIAHRLREQPEPPLKLVLFGEPHLAAMLAQSGVASGSREDAYVLNLPPLALEDTGEYLQHRLAAAGFEQSLPLTAHQLEALHKAGHGLPAQINRQAAHFLSELLDIASALEDEPVSLSPALKRSLVGFGGVLLVGILLFQLPKLFEPEDIRPRPAGTLPGLAVTRAPAATTPAVETSVPATASAPVAAPVPAPEATTAETMPAAQPAVTAAETSTPAAEVLPSPSQAQAATEPEPEPEVKPEPEPVVQPEPEPKPRPAAVAESEPVPAPRPVETASPRETSVPALSLSLPGNEAALKSANPRHYTLQLVGVSDKAKLDGFIRRHGLGGDLRVYRTERGGKPFYILVQGVYPSRAAARAALARLPGLPEKPWLKSLAAVHKDMAAH